MHANSWWRKLWAVLHKRQADQEFEDMIVSDQPMSKVAEALNERGLRTRTGKAWTKPAVFQMLPRLIEVGPRIFSTEEWRRRRGRLLRAVQDDDDG